MIKRVPTKKDIKADLVVSDKGAALEEALRHYFLGMGYFVIRGVKFRVNSMDITDVDLWLYSKPSALARQRSIVDIKNKKTPQAIERVFWTLGIGRVLGVDSCMVATTDSRTEVRDFGLLHGVNVLDGPFLSRLQASPKSQIVRMSEEEFLHEAEKASLGKFGGDWRGRYEAAKSRVIANLNFDGCNSHLQDVQYFIENWLLSSHSSEAALRLTYALMALHLLTIDFVLKEHTSLDSDGRLDLLQEGIRYGDSGKLYAKRLVGLVGGLTEAAGLSSGVGRSIVAELERQASDVPAEMLAEHYSKPHVMAHIFHSALEFEAAAFSPKILLPTQLSPPTLGMLAVVTDFLKLDRKKVLV